MGGGVGPAAQWSPKERTEENRAFYQERLALFAKVMFYIYVVFCSMVAAVYLVYPSAKPAYGYEQLIVAIPGMLILLFLWQAILVRGKPSQRALYAIDTFIVATVGIVFGVDCFLSYDRMINIFSTFIWNTFMVFGRVLYVPSTARRTAILSTTAMAPLVLGGVGQVVYFSEHLEVPAGAWLAGASLYAGTAVAIATIGSRVIYGLRRQVREAQQLGQYTLGEKIGEGGMGAVYVAHHALLRRPTAIKLLPPDKSGRDSLTRFEREVQMTAQLTHPNTVAIFDYGRSPDGVFYYAMEFLDGVDLETLVRVDGPQRAARVVHILSQVCGSLEEAHKKGLIHRDIKPANILLCERGGVPDVAKVVDFGLVRDLETKSLVTGNAIAGTPAYLAPEAINAPDSIGPPGDLYAMGAVAYFLLTGKLVFDGATVIEVCVHHVRSDPTAPSARTDNPIPTGLEELIMACLAKDPSARPTAHELRIALARLALDSEWTEREASAWWKSFEVPDPVRRAAAMATTIVSPETGVLNIGRVAAGDWRSK